MKSPPRDQQPDQDHGNPEKWFFVPCREKIKREKWTFVSHQLIQWPKKGIEQLIAPLTPSHWLQQYWSFQVAGECGERWHRCSYKNEEVGCRSSCGHHRSSESRPRQCLALDRSSSPWKLQWNVKFRRVGYTTEWERDYLLLCSTSQGHMERALWTFQF